MMDGVWQSSTTLGVNGGVPIGKERVRCVQVDPRSALSMFAGGILNNYYASMGNIGAPGYRTIFNWSTDHDYQRLMSIRTV